MPLRIGDGVAGWALVDPGAAGDPEVPVIGTLAVLQAPSANAGDFVIVDPPPGVYRNRWQHQRIEFP